MITILTLQRSRFITTNHFIDLIKYMHCFDLLMNSKEIINIKFDFPKTKLISCWFMQSVFNSSWIITFTAFKLMGFCVPGEVKSKKALRRHWIYIFLFTIRYILTLCKKETIVNKTHKQISNSGEKQQKRQTQHKITNRQTTVYSTPVTQKTNKGAIQTL